MSQCVVNINLIGPACCLLIKLNLKYRLQPENSDKHHDAAKNKNNEDAGDENAASKDDDSDEVIPVVSY